MTDLTLNRILFHLEGQGGFPLDPRQRVGTDRYYENKEDIPTGSRYIGILTVDDNCNLWTLENGTADEDFTLIAPPLDNVLSKGNTSTRAMTVGAMTVTGDLTVQGSTVQVDSEIITADAVIEMNDGEAGAGVTLGYAGFLIKRGTLDDYWMGFDEQRDTFTVGQVTSLSAAQIATTQPIATREDSPIDGGFAVWSQSNNRFETTASGGLSPWNTNGNDIYYDAGNVGINTDSPYEALTIKGNSKYLGFFTNSNVTTTPNFQLGLNGSGDSYILLKDSSLNNQGLITADASDNYITNGKFGFGVNVPLANVHIKSGDAGVTVPANTDHLLVETSGNTSFIVASPSSGIPRMGFANELDYTAAGLTLISGIDFRVGTFIADGILKLHGGNGVNVVTITEDNTNINVGDLTFGDGDTGFYELSDDQLVIKTGSNDIVRFNGNNPADMTIDMFGDFRVGPTADELRFFANSNNFLDSANGVFYIRNEVLAQPIRFMITTSASTYSQIMNVDSTGVNITGDLVVGRPSNGTAEMKLTNDQGSVKFRMNGNDEFEIYNELNDTVKFGTNNIERFRLTATGNLLVNSTSDTGERFKVIGTSKLQGNAEVQGQLEIDGIGHSVINMKADDGYDGMIKFLNETTERYMFGMDADDNTLKITVAGNAFSTPIVTIDSAKVDWDIENRFKSSLTKFYGAVTGVTDRRLTITMTASGLAQMYNYDEGDTTFHDFEFGGTSTPGTGMKVMSDGAVHTYEQFNITYANPTILLAESDETGRHRIRVDSEELRFQYAADGVNFSTIFEIRETGPEVITGVLSGNGSGLNSVNAETLGGISASGFNQNKGTDTDLSTTGAEVISSISLTQGVIMSDITKRTLTLANLGFTGDTNANYITNNNQLTNGAGYLVDADLSAFGLALVSSLADVATSGDYNDLINLPTIPTDNASLANGAGYATETWVSSNHANIAGNDSTDFSVRLLELKNIEPSNLTSAGEFGYDANDSAAPSALGPFTSSPVGIYIHDGNNIIKIWNTDHFTGTHVSNWQTAFGWGDHSGLYSLLSHNHDGVYEPTFSKNTGFNKNFGTTSGTVVQGNDSRIANGETAFGWGDHSGLYALVAHDHDGIYEPVFSKNTAFNKNFGTAASTVAEGNDSRIVNGQIAFGWGDHSGLYNPTIGTNTDIGTINAEVINTIVLTNGVITGFSSRTLTLANLGFTGDTNANYITNNNQIANGENYITLASITKTLIDGLNVDADTIDGLNSSAFIRSDADDNVTANIEWQDNYQVRVGNGADGRFWHNGSNTYLDNVNGDFYIRSQTHGGDIYIQGEDSGGTNEPMIHCIGGAEIILYYDGDKKLETTVTGVTITGSLVATGGNSTQWNQAYAWGDHGAVGYLVSSDITKALIDGLGVNADTVDNLHASSFIRSDADDNVTGHTEWQDDKKIRFGNSADLEIWHNSTSGECWIKDESTGGLNIISEQNLVMGTSRLSGATRKAQLGVAVTDPIEIAIEAVTDGTNVWASLLYNENLRLNTTNGGVLVTGDLEVTGEVSAYASSDINLKSNIKYIAKPLELIKRIKGYSFDWNDLTNLKGSTYGLIAQEVKDILPNSVTTRNNGFLAINYNSIIPLVVNSVNELSGKVDHHSTEIASLKNRIKELENELNQLR